MILSPATRLVLRVLSALTLLFIWIPLVIVGLYAFNDSRVQSWPLKGFTLEWFSKALDNEGARDALFFSVRVALGATLVALLLGTLLSLAVARYRFFGRESLSFLVILPIALPGIVTGMALNATFCIVVVYNNVVARLRRNARSFEEASADLGASTWQTARDVLYPAMRTALLAGGLLAFALSFDEVIVTTFTAGADQTLPIWILNNLSRPNQLPVVNVVALFVIVLSFIPVYAASRLASDSGGFSGAR